MELLPLASYIVDQAASTGSSAPFTIFASSDAKKAMLRATSSALMTVTGSPFSFLPTCIWTTGLGKCQHTSNGKGGMSTYKNVPKPTGSKHSMLTEDAILVLTPDSCYFVFIGGRGGVVYLQEALRCSGCCRRGTAKRHSWSHRPAATC